jgi:succinoglycan biosynthesis transport protein ExoP
VLDDVNKKAETSSRRFREEQNPMLSRTDASRSTLDDPYEPPARPRNLRGSGAGLPFDMSDPRSLWMLLRWRASLIALCTLLAVVASVVALFALPPKYKATTIVLVDPRQPRVTQTEAVLSGIGSDAAAVESQVELIESSALARRLIARLKLDQDPEFATSSLLEHVMGGVLAMFGGKAGDADQEMSRLVSKFQKGLSVRRRGLTYVLEISYVAATPAKAARLSDAVADAYLDDQRVAKAEITTRASTWLVDRIEAMRSRVRASEEAVAAYKSANNIVDVTQGNRLVSRQVEDITQQLALQRSRTADARARLERIQQGANQASDPAALSESLQSQVIANLRTQYTEAARVEAEYSALYGSRYPGLVAVRAQLADIRKQIEAEIGRILVAVRNEYQVAAAHEASLEATLGKLKEQSGQYNEANVKLQELEREAQANRALFEQFLNRAKETTEQQSLQIPDARVISPALIPLKPDRPPAVVLLLAAAVGGGVLGLGLVLALERMRRGFRTADEIESLLSLPTFGILASSDAVAKGRQAASRTSLPHGRTARLAPGRSDDLVIAAEANLQAIRARLRQAQSVGCGESLIVLSALPGEGKTTFARNYAAACAQAGLKTLLIDADFHTRSATRAFGIAGAGLRDVAQGDIQLFAAMRKEPRSGLHILGAGSEPQVRNQADDLDDKTLAAVLRDCEKQFDLVVIDSPAVLPTAGRVPMLKDADRALLVIEWERTDRQAVAEALELLEPECGKIAGAVLNKVPPQWCRFFDSGRYFSVYNQLEPVQPLAVSQRLAMKKAG